jgi:hypothetical protein
MAMIYLIKNQYILHQHRQHYCTPIAGNMKDHNRFWQLQTRKTKNHTQYHSRKKAAKREQ